MRNHLTLSAVVPVVLLLTACGGGGSSSTEPTQTPTEATSSPTVQDVTAQVKAAAGENADVITAATEDEPGYVQIDTTIVDPRGDDGSPEALQAVAICEAARSIGYTNVKVMEADGTHFSIIGRTDVAEDSPFYGEGCIEV